MVLHADQLDEVISLGVGITVEPFNNAAPDQLTNPLKGAGGFYPLAQRQHTHALDKGGQPFYLEVEAVFFGALLAQGEVAEQPAQWWPVKQCAFCQHALKNS